MGEARACGLFSGFNFDVCEAQPFRDTTLNTLLSVDVGLEPQLRSATYDVLGEREQVFQLA